jgi:hypothetical protein
MHKRQARRPRLAAPPASAFPALSKTEKHNNKGDWRMADPSNFDENPAGRVAREQTLARLMEAAAVLAAARFGPDGAGLFRDVDEDCHFVEDDGFKWGYRCCLSIVLNEYFRMIRHGFLDDPEMAIRNYSKFIEQKIGFKPSAKFD